MEEDFKEQVKRALSEGIRFDGRKLLDFRKLEVETGIIETAEGSSRVKLGDTEILCGIKLEVGTPYPDTPSEGTISVNAELLPLSSPEFESGPPGEEATEVARVVDRGIREAKTLDFKKLCIEEGKKAWIVNIDLCTINNAGNLIDASGIAALAALKNARMPEFDGEKVDYKKKTNKKLPLTRLPLPCTVIKIGDKFLVDPSSEEETVTEARLTVAVTEKNTLCALQKGGDYPITEKDVSSMVDIAIETTGKLREMLKEKLKE